MKTRLSVWLLPRLRDVLFLAIFVSVLVLGYRMLNMDGDLPRHLLMGRYVVETRSVPTTEPFLYPSAGKAFVASEWAGELLLYLAYGLGGPAGVVLLSAAVLATTFALLYAELSTRFKLSLPVLLLVGWGAAITSLHWIARPHLFSMLLLAICLVWTDRLARGEKVGWWQLPVLFAIWSNIHGEFIVGILVLFAYAAGWTWDRAFRNSRAAAGSARIWLVLLLSLVATFINPAGYRPWLTIFGYLGNHYLMTHMAETNAPNFQDPGMFVVLAMLAFSIFLLSVKKLPISTGRAFLLAGFSLMVLVTIRNVHLYGIVAPFVLAEALAGLEEIGLLGRLETVLSRIETQLRGALWPALTVLALGTLVLSSAALRGYYRFDPGFFPVQAVSWLEEHPQSGNMFNNLDWGGYIDLRLWPRHPAFIDSVSDMSGGLSSEFETVVTLSNGWQDVLARNQVAWVIMPTGSPLVRLLSADPQWEGVYSDGTAAILRKK